MKKNAMLKIAAILMVAVLLTTCAISSTFAKYASNFKASATARVAKWGVTAATKLESDVDALFADKYGKDDKAPNVEATIEVVDGKAVYNGVIAPGTMDAFSVTSEITGTPEVSVSITYSLKIEMNNMPDTATDPLVWSLDGTTWKSAAQIEADVAAIAAQTVAAGTDLSKATVNGFNLQWKWAFEATGDDVTANDDNDTKFGEAAAAGTSVPYVTVEVTTNIYQSGAAVKDANT